MNTNHRHDRHTARRELAREAYHWNHRHESREVRPRPAGRPTVRLAAASALLLALLMSSPAHALLNEFSNADGYMSPFSTRVWTYNPLWHFDGGTIGSNYVAQHGYNAGFAFGEPFALVVRNDSAADNYRFSYDFESADLGGLNPASIGSGKLTMSFDVCSTVAQNSGTANGSPMLTMKFGGTPTAPGLTLGFSDSNYLMWSDGGGSLNEYTGYTLNASSWDRVTLTMDFATAQYDLSVASMTGDGINGSSTYTPTTTYNVVSGMSFTNSLSSLQNLYFETFTDPEDGLGWGKAYFDNFDAVAVPEPATWTLLGIGIAGAMCFARRRSQRGLGSSAVLAVGVVAVLVAGSAYRADAANIITNGGFELPATTLTTVGQYNESIVPGWETTAPDNNIELWSNGYGSVFAAEGNQHAELNANFVSTLYQDISAIPASSTVGYSFFHRGRTGVDTLRLTISDLGTDNLAGGSGSASDTVLFSQLFSTGSNAWVQYAATNIGNTTLGNDMRFAFESVSAAGGDQRIGNFLDGVQFGIGVGNIVPEPASVALACYGALAGVLVGRRRAMRRSRSRPE